jgi:uncharacterized membrane protein
MSIGSARPGISNGRPQPRKAGHLDTPTLTVFVYDTTMGAAAGEVRLRDLNERNALHIHDAVTVTWIPGAHRPRIGHLRHETSATAARGSVLGGLVGLIFLEASDGAADLGVPALARRFRGTGIDQTFLEDLKAQLRPETSALLVLAGRADLDEVRPVIERGLARGDIVLMHARLPEDAVEVIRDGIHDLQQRSQAD